jgi:hypothetical protein
VRAMMARYEGRSTSTRALAHRQSDAMLQSKQRRLHARSVTARKARAACTRHSSVRSHLFATGRVNSLTDAHCLQPDLGKE